MTETAHDVPMEDRHPMTGNRMSSDEDTGAGSRSTCTTSS